jgi:hypothetical protein
MMKILYGRLTKKTEMSRAPLLDLRPAAHLGIVIYAVVTYLFGSLVLVFFCRFLAPRIQALPSEARRLIESVLEEWLQGNAAGVVVGLVQLIFLVVMVLGAGRLLKQAVPSATGMATFLFRRIWGVCRKVPRQG